MSDPLKPFIRGVPIALLLAVLVSISLAKPDTVHKSEQAEFISTREDNTSCGSQKLMVSTDFAGGAQGWTTQGDAKDFKRGNGFIQATDKGDGVLFFFRAPQNYAGVKSEAYGGRLDFELNPIANGYPTFQWSLVHISDGETELIYDPTTNPPADDGWTRLSVCLKEGDGWFAKVKGGKARAATLEDFKRVLASIVDFRINPEHTTSRETVGLRNVRLYAGDTSSNSGQVDIAISKSKLREVGQSSAANNLRLIAEVEILNKSEEDLPSPVDIALYRPYKGPAITDPSRTMPPLSRLRNTSREIKDLKAGEVRTISWDVSPDDFKSASDSRYPNWGEIAIAVDYREQVSESDEENNLVRLNRVVCDTGESSSARWSVEWKNLDKAPLEEKKAALLCLLQVEAKRIADNDNRTVRGSTFVDNLATNFLAEYLRRPNLRNYVEAISELESAQLNPVNSAPGIQMRIPPAIASRYPKGTVPDRIVPATEFFNTDIDLYGINIPWLGKGKNVPKLSLIDVPFLVGAEIGATSDRPDFLIGGKNYSQVMHWATGLKYFQVPAQAMQEFFVGYEYWHLEGFDIFGEDSINDLIAEEQARRFGLKWFNSLQLLQKTGAQADRLRILINLMDDSFRESSAWTGALIRHRREDFEKLILQESLPTSLAWWGAIPKAREETGAPWGDSISDPTFHKMLDAGSPLHQISETGLFERLTAIYALIYFAENWEKANGQIPLSTLTKDVLDGKYDPQFKAAPKDYNDSWDLTIRE